MNFNAIRKGKVDVLISNFNKTLNKLYEAKFYTIRPY